MQMALAGFGTGALLWLLGTPVLVAGIIGVIEPFVMDMITQRLEIRNGQAKWRARGGQDAATLRD